MADQAFIDRMMAMDIDEYLDQENCPCEALCTCTQTEGGTA